MRVRSKYIAADPEYDPRHGQEFELVGCKVHEGEVLFDAKFSESYTRTGVPAKYVTQ